MDPMSRYATCAGREIHYTEWGAQHGRTVIAWHGLYTIQWDVETGDPDPTIDAERMNWAVRERVQNGSIIIMHANGRGWHTAEALPEMIEYLRGQGYTLVTVSQLVGLEPLPGD